MYKTRPCLTNAGLCRRGSSPTSTAPPASSSSRAPRSALSPMLPFAAMTSPACQKQNFANHLKRVRHQSLTTASLPMVRVSSAQTIAINLLARNGSARAQWCRRDWHRRRGGGNRQRGLPRHRQARARSPDYIGQAYPVGLSSECGGQSGRVRQRDRFGPLHTGGLPVRRALTIALIGLVPVLLLHHAVDGGRAGS